MIDPFAVEVTNQRYAAMRDEAGVARLLRQAGQPHLGSRLRARTGRLLISAGVWLSRGSVALHDPCLSEAPAGQA